MSYILEALKKSDQQRQRGATPTLPTAQVAAAAPKQPVFLYYGLLAAALLGAGILIGWLRPWQAEQPAPATEPIAAKSPISISHQTAPAPLPEPPEGARKTTQELPPPNSTPAAQPAPRVAAMKPDIPAPAKAETHSASPRTAAAPASMPEKPAGPADAAQEQRAILMSELPLPIQQEIPAMTIQLHAYSSKPKDRLVSINDRMLREGESLTPDLRLEQITPDGLIFSYKGYRFRRGVQ
ncbi:MAG: general secretion pathway protein GspB [Sulfuricella sp.]